MKAVLLDTDGVLLKGKYKYFSERYSKEYNIPLERIMLFFTNEFEDCLTNKSDIKEVVKPYLEKWNWKKGVNNFLNYWFEEELTLNIQMIKIVNKLRQNNVKCFVVADQEKNRAKYILENWDFVKYFDDIFFSCNIGFTKSDPRFFEKILNFTKINNPKEIYYWDDGIDNIKSAQSIGITSYHYTTFEKFKIEISKKIKLG